jgi:hypothetical protein
VSVISIIAEFLEKYEISVWIVVEIIRQPQAKSASVESGKSPAFCCDAQRCFRDITHGVAGCLAMLHDCYALLFIVGFFIYRYMSVHRVRSPPPN